MIKRLKVAIIMIISILVILLGTFFVYVSVYYRADDVDITVMQNEYRMSVEDNYIILSPSTPSKTALIFYPGAKVEYTAYLPIMEKIKEATGITCILVKMPFNLAVLDADKADEIINQFPNIERWYLGGHSMGGAMASDYASKNQDKVNGLILLGAYLYGDYPIDKALTIYGTFNTSVSEKIEYTQNIVAIEGGNHAQFGNYGKQKGDPDATISREQQQNAAVEAIKEFLMNQNN